MTNPANNLNNQEILEFIIKLKFEEMQRGLDEAGKKVQSFDNQARQTLRKTGQETDQLGRKGKQMAKDWSDSMQKMEQGMQKLAATSAVALGAVTAAAGVSTKAFADFESQLNNLEAVSGASTQEMGALSAKALELGASTKFASSQMAETAVELAKLGFVSQDIIDSIDGIVSAAAASGVSLAEAGSLVAGTLRGFQLNASDAAFVADVLAQAANASALSMADLSLSMKYVAPVSAAAGQSLTDMVGIMGVLSNSMIKGETAGTAMRAMLVRLQAPAGEAKKAFEMLEFSAADAEGKIKPMPQLISELREKLKDFNQASQNKLLADIFGTEALSAASVLMKTTEADLQAMIGQIANAEGTSKRMANTMQRGINHELDLLKSVSEAAAISMGEKFAPAVISGIQGLQKFFEIINALPEPVKQTAAEVTVLAGSLAALGLGLSGAVLGTTRLIGMLKALIPQMVAARMAAAGFTGLAAGIAVAGAGAIYGTYRYQQNKVENEQQQRDLAQQKWSSNDAEQMINSYSRAGYERELQRLQAEEDAAIKSTGRSKEERLALEVKLLEIKQKRADAEKLIGDLTQLSNTEMQKALTDAQDFERQLQGNLDKFNSIKQQLGAAEKALADERRRLGNFGNNMETSRLTRQIDALRKELLTTTGTNSLAQAEQMAGNLEGRISRLQGFNQKMTQALEQRYKEMDEHGSTEGKRSLDEKLSEETDALLKELEKRREAQQDMQARVMADSLSTQQQTAVQGQKLAEEAMTNVAEHSRKEFKRIEVSGGKCWAAVGEALRRAGLADGVRHTLHAYQAAEDLAKSKYFNEIEWDRKSTLPAGAVVVWGKGNSPSGHISVADGKGNEISDFVGPQMKSHYGGGAPRVFVTKDTEAGQGIKTALEQQHINERIAEYNSQIQALIAHQGKLTKGSEDYQKVESEIEKIKREAFNLGTDLIEAETKAREEAAAAAKQLAEEQQRNAEQMLQAVDQVRARIQSQAANIEKMNRQRGMTEIERTKDNYASDLAAANKEIERLQESMVGINVSSEQRALINRRILEIQYDITKLQQAQGEHLKWLTEEEEKRAKIKERQQRFEKELKPVEEQRKLIQEMERQLDLALRLEQISPEAAIKERMRIQREKTNADKTELEITQRQHRELIAQSTTQKELEDNQGEINRLKAREEKLQQDINEGLDQQKVSEKELKDLAVERLEKEIALRRQISDEITRAFEVQARTLALMSGMDPMNAGEIGRWASSAVNSLTSVTQAWKKAQDVFDESGKKVGTTQVPVNILDMLSVDGMGGIVGMAAMDGTTLDPTGAMQIMSFASDLKSLLDSAAEWFKSGMLRTFVGDTEAMQEAAQQYERDMLDLDLRIREQRLRNAKAAGQDVFEAEKQLLADRMQFELDELARQGEKLKNTSTGWFWQQTPEEKQAYEQWLDSRSKRRTEIEERTQAQLEQMERERLERQAENEKNHYRQMSDLRLGLVANRAALSGDPMAEAAAARDQARSAARRAFFDAIEKTKGQNLSNEDAQVYFDKLNTDLELADKQFKERSVQITSDRVDRFAAMADEIAISQAKLTEDNPFDDLEAEHQKAMNAIALAREKELIEVGLNEAERERIKDKYRLQELIAEQSLANKKKELRKKELQDLQAEYREKLNQQKTLIQEGLSLERRQYEDLIAIEEQKMRGLQQRVEGYQRQIDELRKERNNALKEWDPEDSVQSAQFLSELAGLNADPYAWQGVEEISNTARRAGLTDVSGSTARMGLLEQARLMEMGAQNDWRRELISREEFVKRMQQVQLLRARAADMELATEKLTTEQRLKLEEEWADAYQQYQEFARMAVEAHYDAREQAIQSAMEKEQNALQSSQQAIEGYRGAISELQTAADKDLRLIDDAILKLDQSTRNWGERWVDVAEGIRQAREQMQQTQAAGGGGGSSYSGSGAGSTGGQGASFGTGRSTSQGGTFVVDGGDGYYYQSTSAMLAAQGLAAGGFIPDLPKFDNDGYGPVWLDRKEAVIPFDEWPNLLRPFMPTSEPGRSLVFNPTILIQGNHIASDVDMYQTSQSAMTDFWNDALYRHGHLYGGV